MRVQSEEFTPKNIESWRLSTAKLVEPYYADLGQILEKDYIVDGEIFYVKDDLGLLAFIVGFEINLPSVHQSEGAYFLGLSGTRPGNIGHGIRSACTHAVIGTLRSRFRRTFVIATCATTPTVFLFRRVLSDTTPNIHNHVTDHECLLIQEFRHHFGYGDSCANEPVNVVRNASKARFTRQEFERQTSNKYTDDAFDQLAISEREGDRLIVTGWA